MDGADLYSYLIIFGIFVRDLAETPKLEVFAPPPPPPRVYPSKTLDRTLFCDGRVTLLARGLGNQV